MFPFLLALAILPGLFICFYILRMDKYEKEPHLPLLICFGLGMLSTIPAMFLEQIGISRGWDHSSNLATTFLYSIIGIALIEELVKFLILRGYPFQRKFFNEPMDGIVYSVLIGMGFATLENILYAGSFGLQTTLVRAFTAVPAHAAFAVIMGYYAGLAKFDPANRSKLLLTGFAWAVVIHGVYDFFLLQEFYTGLSVLAIATLYYSVKHARKMILLHQENSPFREDEANDEMLE